MSSEEDIALLEDQLDCSKAASLLAHGYGCEPAKPRKLYSLGANFRFDAPSPTGSQGWHSGACASNVRQTNNLLGLRLAGIHGSNRCVDEVRRPSAAPEAHRHHLPEKSRIVADVVRMFSSSLGG